MILTIVRLSDLRSKWFPADLLCEEGSPSTPGDPSQHIRQSNGHQQGRPNNSSINFPECHVNVFLRKRMTTIDLGSDDYLPISAGPRCFVVIYATRMNGLILAK